jgi:hypothetical protein
MALSGQASGGWTESSSALRLLHVGIRNTVGVLTTDSFTMINPVGALAGGNYAAPTSAGFDSSVLGVLGGSVAFTRGDQGPNEIGGPDGSAPGAPDAGVRALGVFINTAAGNDFENQPAVASDKGPYVSGQGTYGNSLYETSSVALAAITYSAGNLLYAGANGYLTNDAADAYNAAAPTIMGVLKMPADTVQPEIVYDQRI